MGLILGHGAWQIDQPSDGSILNSYSFQPVGQRMGYSIADLRTEGCCRSLNAWFNNVSVPNPIYVLFGNWKIKTSVNLFCSKQIMYLAR